MIGRSDFVHTGLLYGDEMLRDAENPSTLMPMRDMHGFVRYASEKPDWELVPIASAAYYAGGLVDDGFCQAFFQDIETKLEAAKPFDAVFAALHGSVLTPSNGDATGTFVSKVRDVVGDQIRFIATTDMHSNVSAQMIRGVDSIIGFKTNPHMDIFETGEKAGRLMELMLEQPIFCAGCRTAVLPSPTTLLSSKGVVRDLFDHGDEVALDTTLDISFYSSYPYSTSENCSAVVTATDRASPENAQRVARLVGDKLVEWQARFADPGLSIDAAVKFALEHGGKKTIGFGDAGDNPDGGSTADYFQFLKALVEHDVEDFLYGFFNQPAIAEAALEAGAGREIDVEFSSEGTGERWRARAGVLAVGEHCPIGRRGLNIGVPIDMGLSAALRIGRGVVVVTSKRVSARDPVMFECLGIELDALRCFVLKGELNVRAGFDEYVPQDEFVSVDAGGLTPLNPRDWGIDRYIKTIAPLSAVTSSDNQMVAGFNSAAMTS